MLCIIFSVVRFKYYLIGRKFVLEVNHHPLTYLHKLKATNARLTRWALSLQPYRFRVVHIAEANDIGADLLSRSSM